MQPSSLTTNTPHIHTERLIKPETFAEILCHDLDISTQYVPVIAESICMQVQEFVNTLEAFESLDSIAITEQQTFDFLADMWSGRNVVIKLDVHVGRLNLRDRFVWDPAARDLSPEDFARLLAADLGLGGEFPVLVAATIREQLFRAVRDRLEGEWWDEEEAYASHVLPGSVVRNCDDADEWAPDLVELAEDEREKVLMDQERSMRRMRRETASRYSTAHSRRSMAPFSLPPLSTPPLRRRSRMFSSGTATPTSQSKLLPDEYDDWRCSHCNVGGRGTPIVRRGPLGPRVCSGILFLLQ